MTADVASLDAVRARTLTDQIKVAVEGTWHLITEAYTNRAWSALGYASWDEYCTREFGTSRLRLPREERQEVVSSLREQGLSLRAIQAVTGADVKTIRSDLSQQVREIPTPDSAELDPSGLDEFVAPEAARVVIEDQGPDEFDQKIADELARSEGRRIEHETPVVDPEPVKVTGTDGKQYAAKARTAPYRKPLPEVAKGAGFDLRKAMERIEKLFEDNRYRQNEEQVANALRGHLLYVAETVAAVLDQLP